MNSFIYNNVFDIQNKLARALETDSRTSHISKLFSVLQNNEQRVDFVYELLREYELLPQFVKDGKSNEKATFYREQGNQKFRVKNDAEALTFYSKSIAYAETSSECIGLAYANRAAVLFELKLYRECLIDIQRASENNYPEKLGSKLLSRKAKATALLPTQKPHLYHEPIPQIPENERNPVIQCASKAVKIEDDYHVGRHIIATRDIPIGEVIAVETPSFVILLEHLFSHCHECLTLCYNPIPCNNCSQTLFCSVDCKNKADAAYHKYECPIMLSIHHLNLDKLKTLPLKIAICVRDQYKQLNAYHTDPKEVYMSGRYQEIHRLVSNSDKRKIADLFERSITASVVFDLVKKYTSFFSRDESDFTQQVFKDLMLFHLQTSACNFHEIVELGENDVGIYEVQELGAGAYSFLSLFNHSCNPNIDRCYYGTTIVLKAIETIKEGEEVFENYGQHYALTSKPERQAKMSKQYFFDCNCIACVNNWPTYQNLTTLPINMDVMLLNIPKLTKASLDTAKRIEMDLIDLLRKLEGWKPCKNFGEIQETLKQCYAIYGNKRKTLKPTI